MEEGAAWQRSDMAGQLDREYSGPDQVCHVEPQLSAQGGEGLAEVWKGTEAKGMHWQNQRWIHGRYEEQGDENPSKGCGSVFHW